MSEKRMKMSFLAEPNDANYKGNVHGGGNAHKSEQQSNRMDVSLRNNAKRVYK